MEMRTLAEICDALPRGEFGQGWRPGDPKLQGTGGRALRRAVGAGSRPGAHPRPRGERGHAERTRGGGEGGVTKCQTSGGLERQEGGIGNRPRGARIRKTAPCEASQFDKLFHHEVRAQRRQEVEEASRGSPSFGEGARDSDRRSKGSCDRGPTAAGEPRVAKRRRREELERGAPSRSTCGIHPLGRRRRAAGKGRASRSPRRGSRRKATRGRRMGGPGEAAEKGAGLGKGKPKGKKGKKGKADSRKSK